MMSIKLSIAVVVLLLASLVGCGSDSDGSTSRSSSSATGRKSKANFIHRGDQICLRAQKKRESNFNKLLAENGEKPPLGRAEREKIIVNVVLPPLKRMSKELAGLRGPSVSGRDARAVVVAYKKAVHDIERNPSLAFSSAFASADRLAAEFGFKICPAT